jgi:hypothetical protein
LTRYVFPHLARRRDQFERLAEGCQHIERKCRPHVGLWFRAEFQRFALNFGAVATLQSHPPANPRDGVDY